MCSAYKLNKQGDNIQPWHTPFPICSISGSNYCFLTCIQISQEAGKVMWCSHLLKNFPQFVVIHTVKSFAIVNKSEVIFPPWNSLAFSMIQQMLAVWYGNWLWQFNPQCHQRKQLPFSCHLSFFMLICMSSVARFVFQEKLEIHLYI